MERELPDAFNAFSAFWTSAVFKSIAVYSKTGSGNQLRVTGRAQGIFSFTGANIALINKAQACIQTDLPSHT
jgi:hypothetical protein